MLWVKRGCGKWIEADSRALNELMVQSLDAIRAITVGVAASCASGYPSRSSSNILLFRVNSS